VRRLLSATALVLAAGSLVSCAITPGSTRESVGEGIHSTSASNAIQFKYQKDRMLAPLGLKVETYQREVFVSGQTQNEAQRARAVAIARDYPGILAAYFVETDLPGRPVSRAHYRARAEQVWSAMVAALRSTGYQIEEQRDSRVLVTGWKRIPSSWQTLWMSSQSRLRLALYPQGDVVTVIAVADRLDEVSLTWQIKHEQAILRDIMEALTLNAPARS
jgi:hypothetical protein